MRDDAVGYTDLTEITAADGHEWACMMHPGVWSEARLGFVNEPFHYEWYELEMRHRRFAVVAPREHAKSEVYSVNTTAHHVLYRPGSWQYVFSSTLDQSKILLERVVSAVAAASPDLLASPPKFSTTDVVFRNWARVTVASVGKAIRGIHPDRIVGDDVLKEENTLTNLQRRRLESWWLGTVGPMAHPGSTRPMGFGRLRPKGRVPIVYHPPTTIGIVGTPFHQLDLLMSLRDNPIYVFRRYSSSFVPSDLVSGTFAVEASGGLLRAA